jgi:inosine/xanthosine triphosphatase
MKVLVGSQNPVKIQAVGEAFAQYFDNLEVIGLEVDSQVPPQPINDDTFTGAKNRVLALHDLNTQKELGAQFFVGIEGGIIRLYGRWFAFGCMAIGDTHGRLGFGTSPLFELPEWIAQELLAGKELGEVIDHLTGDHNTKQKGGAIGFLTQGVMDRKALYVQGLVVALVPFVNERLYGQLSGGIHKKI